MAGTNGGGEAREDGVEGEVDEGSEAEEEDMMALLGFGGFDSTKVDSYTD